MTTSTPYVAAKATTTALVASRGFFNENKILKIVAD